MASTLFVDRETGNIDVGEVVAEATPIAKLTILVAVVAFVPLAFELLLTELGAPWLVVAPFAAATQFVFVVGGVVLLYIVHRGTALARDD